MKNILVIGLGLIGGSIAKSLNKTEFNVFGMDTNSQTIEKAISEKVIAQICNHIEEFLSHNDDGIIVFATSPSAIPCISTSCKLQKSAICLKVKVVFSTSQAAVAIGIKGEIDILIYF